MKNNKLIIAGVLILTLFLIVISNNQGTDKNTPSFYITSGYYELDEFKMEETLGDGSLSIRYPGGGLCTVNSAGIPNSPECARYQLLKTGKAEYCLYYSKYDIIECILDNQKTLDFFLCEKTDYLQSCKNQLIERVGTLQDCKDDSTEKEDCYYAISSRDKSPEGCRLIWDDEKRIYCLEEVNTQLTSLEKTDLFLKNKLYTNKTILLILLALILVINLLMFLVEKPIIKFSKKYLKFLPGNYLEKNSPGFVTGLFLSLIPWVSLLFGKSMFVSAGKQDIISYIGSAALYPIVFLVQSITHCSGESCMIHMYDPFLALIIYPIAGLIIYSVLKILWRKFK